MDIRQALKEDTRRCQELLQLPNDSTSPEAEAVFDQLLSHERGEVHVHSNKEGKP